MGETLTIPTDLTGSVGRGGQNLGTDIGKVQGLLMIAAARGAGGTAFDPTELGKYSSKVGDAIEQFQRFHTLPQPDGKVDRGKTTWKKLIEVATRPNGWSPPPVPTAGHVLARMPDPPDWQDWGHKSIPLLSNDQVPETVWEMTFGDASLAQWPMTTWAYVCDKSLGTPHVGVGLPEDVTRPSAYLLYFHHSIGQEVASYGSADVRFKKGIGDYMIGRMRGLDQIARSGKDVCLVVPEPTFAGQGVFDSNERLVTQALKEIHADVTGNDESDDLPPLLVASYSDGLERMNNFLNNCPNLRQRVRGVYDFDGMLVTRLAGVSLSQATKVGAKVFRYVGNSSPGFQPKESKPAYLMRCVNRSPSLIPLPKERWVNHPLYYKFKADPGWANSWWMHFYIPSCMLHHGLANTDGV
jgi:hypothetical protein